MITNRFVSILSLPILSLLYKNKFLHIITSRVHKCLWNVSESSFICSGGREEGLSVHNLLAFSDLFQSCLLSTPLTGSVFLRCRRRSNFLFPFPGQQHFLRRPGDRQRFGNSSRGAWWVYLRNHIPHLSDESRVQVPTLFTYINNTISEKGRPLTASSFY